MLIEEYKNKQGPKVQIFIDAAKRVFKQHLYLYHLYPYHEYTKARLNIKMGILFSRSKHLFNQIYNEGYNSNSS